MPGAARQFEPQTTRIGGAPSKYRFTARCSGCGRTDAYESSKSVGDDLVKGYFKDRGWLLGRDRAYDLCPACLAKPREDQRHHSPEAANRSTSLTTPADKRSRDTADILARHLGKPEALAAEVFRPKPVQAPRLPALEAPPQAAPAPAPPSEVEQVLTGMAADLKGLRSTMEILAEQVSKLVALGSQQIEAIAGLAPLVIHSADGISGTLRDVVTAIQSTSGSSSPAEGATTFEEPLTHETKPAGLHDLNIGSETEPPVFSNAKEQAKRPKQPKHKTGKTAAPIVVKSIADAKRPDRFYTSIRLPRELWNQAGFTPDDRLLLDWSGKALTIERVEDGGVKPKAIGDTSVVLQSWKLGDLNFEHPKVSEGEGSLRLTARPLRS